jgi:methionyl-tRNA formyltransferase
LASMGADLLVKTLRALEQGTVHPVAQDHSQASLAPILKKEDGAVDFHRAAVEIVNRLRGFQPWPGAHTRFRGKDLKIIAARPAPTSTMIAPAELMVDGEKLFAGSGGRALELVQVQPEGKKVLTALEFINGYKPKLGERLG